MEMTKIEGDIVLDIIASYRLHVFPSHLSSGYLVHSFSDHSELPSSDR